jgi:hypothetical protein
MKLFMANLKLTSFIIFTLASFTLQATGNNFRWVWDNSVRLNDRNTNHHANNQFSQHYFSGVDTHKIFSNPNGDYGYSVFQLYFTKLVNQSPYPFMFNSPDDSKFIIREAHINFTNSQNNALPNIRIGHFTLPFGLENNTDTNGRLLDYAHGENLGTKLDWGIQLSKVTDQLEYNMSVTLGGKDDPKRTDGSFIISSRIGNLSHFDFTYGLSFYQATLDNKKRKRMAVDLRYYLYSYGILAEFALGEVNTIKQQYALIELNKRSPTEQWAFYSQYVFDKQDHYLHNKQTAIVGARYTPTNRLDISVQINKQLTQFTSKTKTSLARIQLRYRY